MAMTENERCYWLKLARSYDRQRLADELPERLLRVLAVTPVYPETVIDRVYGGRRNHADDEPARHLHRNLRGMRGIKAPRGTGGRGA